MLNLNWTLLDVNWIELNLVQNVNVTNFSTSWADGLAFCALIHHFCPDAFDFSRLSAKNRRANFTLAFETAEYVLSSRRPLRYCEAASHAQTANMRPIATHVAWSVGHNREPYTKTAEPVNRARCRKVWTRVRPTSHVRWSDVTESMVTIRSPCCGYNTI